MAVRPPIILRNVWTPFPTQRSQPSSEVCQDRMEAILQSWVGTSYMSGQRCKGAGADCIGFVFAVIDEMDGRARAQDPLLPRDTALHSPRTARRAVAAMRRLYAPARRLRRSEGHPPLQPGDLLVVGTAGGGPGHLMIVGPRKNTIWHAGPGKGVRQSGWALEDGYEGLHAIYRLGDRHRWFAERKAQ